MGLVNNLSLGLVTHKKSEYFISNSDHEKLTNLIDALHIPCKKIVINSDDKYTQNDLNISLKKIIVELLYYLYILVSMQLKILKYSQYKSISTPLYHIVESIFVTFKPLFFYLQSTFSKECSRKLMTFILRQKNISHAHIEILKKLSKNSSDYILILEDDYQYSNSCEVSKKIKAVLRIFKNNKYLKIVNCSESFTERQLGINKIQLTSYDLETPTNKIIQYKYPAINTACAIIYKQEICNDLIFELESLNKYSFIPIDHKINLSLSKIIKYNKIDSCCYASIVPGIFIQRSIHDQ